MIEIYYIEDDENIAIAVKKYLSQKGCEVSIFGTLASGKKALEHHIPSIALIDWNMPDGEGNSFCRWIRSRWKELPVIFLTVRDDTCDIISGFEYGADDYVTKPFELEVLYSRIHALLRRSGNVQSQYLSCGSISIDKNKTAVFCGEEEITVSRAEYQLLQLLMENKGKIVTRERLLTQIWDNNGNYVNDNTLTVYIKRLREKIETDSAHPKIIQTVRGMGYKVVED